jgi:hypothetical protein
MQLALNANRDKHATVWIHDVPKDAPIVAHYDEYRDLRSIKIGTITINLMDAEEGE